MVDIHIVLPNMKSIWIPKTECHEPVDLVLHILIALQFVHGLFVLNKIRKKKDHCQEYYFSLNIFSEL